jgi:hypothetical protein
VISSSNNLKSPRSPQLPDHAQYTIRRKVFKLFGASFHIYDETGNLVGYCKQKAFKLREDIRLFSDESMTTPLLTLGARSIIDFGVTFDVTLPTGESLGSLRRKGLKSSFIRDEWLLYDEHGTDAAIIREKNAFMAFLRRLNEIIAVFSPQTYEVVSNDSRNIATFQQRFNPFVYRLVVTIHEQDDQLDDLVVLGAGCLIAAIEGRQG